MPGPGSRKSGCSPNGEKTLICSEGKDEKSVSDNRLIVWRKLMPTVVAIIASCAPPGGTGTPDTSLPASTAAPPPALELPDQRSFAMGFTTWPYDFDSEAVDWTWSEISHHADLIAIHLDGGIPWQEALDDSEYPAAVRANLEDNAERSREFDTVYVAATPQHSDRATIARYWNDEGSQRPLPESWAGLTLANPSVTRAYRNYCIRLIEQFDPDYFAYGIEVNAGYESGSEPHRQMLALAEDVYPALKSRFPDLPILLTFQVDSWVTEPDELMDITKSFIPYTDIVGISAYPFLDLSDPTTPREAPAPVDDWMRPLASMGKPVAVTETGFAAEPLAIDSLGVEATSTEQMQMGFLTDLLSTTQDLDALFVVYWEIRDYDFGYEFLVELGADPALARIWRDIGLFDGGGDPRAGLGVWDAWLGVPHAR